MGNTFCFNWEIPFLQWMQSAESSVVNAIAKFVTLFGEEYSLILLVGLCYWCIDKRLGRNVALAVSGSILSGCLIQGVVKRRRPYMDYSEIKCLRTAHSGDAMSVAVQGYSLPSLHSTLAVGGYGTLAMNVKNKTVTRLAVILPILIGLSRLYLGVHYPTDIICGWALGAIVMLLFGFTERKYGYKICLIIQLVIGFAGFFYCEDDGFYSIYGVTLGLFLGFLYEEKYVNFEMNKKLSACILRTVIGVLLFVVISTLLKFPVQSISADEHVTFHFCYRCFRYGLSTFLIMGIYPYLFKRIRFL